MVGWMGSRVEGGRSEAILQCCCMSHLLFLVPTKRRRSLTASHTLKRFKHAARRLRRSHPWRAPNFNGFKKGGNRFGQVRSVVRTRLLQWRVSLGILPRSIRATCNQRARDNEIAISYRAAQARLFVPRTHRLQHCPFCTEPHKEANKTILYCPTPCPRSHRRVHEIIVAHAFEGEHVRDKCRIAIRIGCTLDEQVGTSVHPTRGVCARLNKCFHRL